VAHLRAGGPRDRQPRRPRIDVGRPVPREAVARERGADDERLGDLVVAGTGARRQLPGEMAGAELARPTLHRGGGPPRGLGIKRLPGAEADDDHPALADMTDREMAGRAAGLATPQQGLGLGEIEPVALGVGEGADRERVGIGRDR
jgi:hypothetical protein